MGLQSQEVLTDHSLMPYGSYKGTAMANVPAHYLLWCYENSKCSPSVKQYIEDNMQALRLEQAKHKK